MGHTYRKDNDLEFLQYSSHEMLKVLTHHLIYDGNEIRYAESLSKDKAFIAAQGDYTKVWQLIAAELQHYGGDSIVNTFRRKGVLYKEILIDVCKKLNVKVDDKMGTVESEHALFAHLFENFWKSSTSQERDNVKKGLGVKSRDLDEILLKIKFGNISKKDLALFLAANTAKSTLGMVLPARPFVGAAISKFTNFSGTAVATGSIIDEISGPAFRVTVPCVIQIAAMRQIKLKEGGHFNEN